MSKAHLPWIIVRSLSISQKLSIYVHTRLRNSHTFYIVISLRNQNEMKNQIQSKNKMIEAHNCK